MDEMDDYEFMQFMTDAMVYMDMRDSGKSFAECSKEVGEYMRRNSAEIIEDLREQSKAS